MLIKQLDDMFKVINDEGKGAIIFINQESSIYESFKSIIIFKRQSKA